MKREEELTVSVKPLEWTPYGAETPFGWYEITDQRDAVNPSELRRRMPFLLCGSRTKYTRHETLEAAKAAAQADYEARIRSALLPTPKAEPVGWETESEWELEMRCCNITENTPFAEVSKLINDLWQQYCLAAEPKPEATEGVDRQDHHSKPVASQSKQIVEDNATGGGAHEKVWRPIESAPVGDPIWVAHEAGLMSPAIAVKTTVNVSRFYWKNAYTGLPLDWAPTKWQEFPKPPNPALTAKHTDGREE